MSKIIILRKEINKIDKKILKLFKKRFEISERIGNYKKENSYSIRDLQREKEIIRKNRKKSGLDKKFVKDLYTLIFRESRRVQR